MPRYDKTGPQGNGPRTGCGMGLGRREDQIRISDDESSCKRIRRRQRIRNVSEERVNCNRRGRHAGTGNCQRAGQNVQGSQRIRQRINVQGQGRNAVGQGRIGFVDFE